MSAIVESLEKKYRNNWHQKERFFRTFMEIYDLVQHPSPTGISQALVELERHARNGGEIHSGVIFPQTSCKPENVWQRWRDWAISVNGCLPEDEFKRRLIYERYDSAEMSKERYKKANMPVRLFWQQVREKRLYETGLFIADLLDKKN